MPPDSAQTTPRRGFTLLELSVGIAIIGALMAVTIPMIIGAKNKSEQEQRQANVRTLTDANWRARILGMGGPEITTNAWPDGKPGGCDADIALAFYNRNNLLGKGTEVDLEDLVSGPTGTDVGVDGVPYSGYMGGHAHGGATYVGGKTTVGYYSDGNVNNFQFCEWIIFGRPLTAAEKSLVRSYLAGRWKGAPSSMTREQVADIGGIVLWLDSGFTGAAP